MKTLGIVSSPRRREMRILKKKTAPRYVREEGIVSYLLASPRTSDAKQLTTSVVEISPGGGQRVHSHVPEQIYFILEGGGMMTVGDQREHVGSGDCIFIPTEIPHGLDNDGEVLLRYFSAAAPSFSRKQLEDLWPLKSEAEMNREREGV
jgi:mannose-6-phosphate isomerase-like protein (cupin superfamily)